MCFSHAYGPKDKEPDKLDVLTGLLCNIHATTRCTNDNNDCVSWWCYPPTHYKLSLVKCGCREMLYLTYHRCRIWIRLVRKENYKTAKIVHILCELYVRTIRFTYWYIHNLDIDIFCVFGDTLIRL